MNEVLIDRYPAKISESLSNLYNKRKFVFIYSEKYDYDIPKKVPHGSITIYLPNITRRKIESLFNDYPPFSLTTIAQRIPDMLMVSIFNINKLPTYTVQHGLWSDTIVRLSVIPQIVNKFSKFSTFGRYAFEICSINNFPFFSTIVEMYKFFYLDKTSIKNTRYLKSDILRPKKVFAFDSSWDNYYIEKFGYKKEDLIYIGNPDFLVLKNKDINVTEDAVCYLCQSLVEDGRYLLSDFKIFLQILIDSIIPTKKLYIKLHPRSRVEYYKILESFDNVVFINDFPVCKYYIGHYTSLLAVSAEVTNNILVWKLKNHHIPKYFQEFGSIVTDEPADIVKFISDEVQTSNNRRSKKMTNNELREIKPIETISEYLFKKSLQ